MGSTVQHRGRALAGRPRATLGAVICALAAALGCTSDIGDPVGGGQADGGPDAGPRPDGPRASDAATPDAQPCTEGDAQVVDDGTGACYLLFLTGASWDTARTSCLALGGHLASAADLAENARYASIAPMVAGSGQEDVWIGGTDAAVEGTWLWESGEPMVFEAWRLDPPEPNNGGGGAVENCAIIEGDNGGTWDDRPCDQLYPYLCERR